METRMKKFLITGGAGFIGTALTQELLAQGHFVRVMDNLSGQVHGNTTNENHKKFESSNRYDFHIGDILDKSKVIDVLSNIDVVIHLAAETGTGQSMYELKKYAEVNVVGTAVLLEAITQMQSPIKRLVVSSSRAVYGEGKYLCNVHGYTYPDGRNSSEMKMGNFDIHCPSCSLKLNLVPTDEESRLAASSMYGITKLAQEQMITSFGRTHGVATSILRYQNVFGPGQSLSNPYTGILSIFSTRILNKGSINIFEDGLESRDFIYIDDVAKMTALAALDDCNTVEVFNIGSGISTTVIEAVSGLQAELGLHATVSISGNFRAGDIRHNLADISRFVRHFGYSPEITFDLGIKNFTSWVKRQQINHDRYDQSISELKSNGLLQ
jgi:dTDP-L-rhamnose 4-epimerase